jgi:sulfonate transport system permease protein
MMINSKRLLFRAAPMLLLIGVWEFVSAYVNNPKLMPNVYNVFTRSLPGMAVFSGYPQDSFIGAIETLLIHSGYTLIRIVVGLSIGGVLGVFVGLLLHFFRRSRKGNALILSVVRAIPLFSLIPLFLYWFGGKEIGIYLYIIFSIFVVIATNTYEAVFNVPPTYLYQATLLGASRFQVFRTTVIFAILPQMRSSLRNVIGLSWAFSLGGEYMAARSGVGYLLYQSYLYADMGKLVICTVLYAIYGTLSFTLTKNVLFSLKNWD